MAHVSLHICNHIHYKNLQHNLSKLRAWGGSGSKAVWIFFKKTSHLVAGPFLWCGRKGLIHFGAASK